MKLLFSEATPDYWNYLFPYVIWALPEKENPWEMFDAGFLPGAPDLSRFYLCRQIRVDLRSFRASSENRRILRKGQGLRVRLIPRAEFQYNETRGAFFEKYAIKNLARGDELQAPRPPLPVRGSFHTCCSSRTPPPAPR